MRMLKIARIINYTRVISLFTSAAIVYTAVGRGRYGYMSGTRRNFPLTQRGEILPVPPTHPTQADNPLMARVIRSSRLCASVPFEFISAIYLSICYFKPYGAD